MTRTDERTGAAPAPPGPLSRIERGYRGSSSDTTLRNGSRRWTSAPPQGGGPSKAEPASSRAYDPAAVGDRAPGHEESGGYVDVDEHRY
jgi:hypothetical protein